MGAVDCDKETGMSELVARTGRLRQRYLDGSRLVAGCIPFRYRSATESSGGSSDQIVEVLMINSNSGPGLLFPKVELITSRQGFALSVGDVTCNPIFCPKGGWEDDETVQQAAVREAMEEAGVRGDLMVSLGVYDFKSRTLQDEFCPEGLCKAEMFALHVKEELQNWPEQSTRKRSWLTVSEALECCRHAWMRKALEDGFVKWHSKQGTNILGNQGEVGEEVEAPF